MPIPTLPQRPDAPAPAIPVPPTPVAIQDAAISAELLAMQYQQLAQQLAGLQAQRRVLLNQIGSSEPLVATAARAQLTRVESELARVSVDIAGVRGRMNSTRIGQPMRPPDFPNGRARGPDSDAITAVMITFILAVLMPISIGLTRRLLRRPTKDASASADVIGPRLDRLETAVDAIAIEVERIAEGQRFVTKVMTERPLTAPPRSTTPARTTPLPGEAASNALGEAKPFLALGAGPIEPIRVAERQAVRQSITPH